MLISFLKYQLLHFQSLIFIKKLTHLSRKDPQKIRKELHRGHLQGEKSSSSTPMQSSSYLSGNISERELDEQD